MILRRAYNHLPTLVKDKSLDIGFKLLKPKVKTLFSKFVNEGDLVFDVGAHRGYTTDVLLDLGANIISIDPNPMCIDRLNQRFADNSQVTIVQKGLGDKKTKETFYISTGDAQISSFSTDFINRKKFEDRYWDLEIEVEITTLDELIKEFGTPKFIKIDAEGYDHLVVKGLTQNTPVVMFEADSESIDNANEAMDHLFSLGYSNFNFSNQLKFEFKYPDWVQKEQISHHLTAKRNKNYDGDIFAIPS